LNGSNVAELQRFIKKQNGRLVEIDEQLRPVRQRENSIKNKIRATLRNGRFIGTPAVVDCVVWCGSTRPNADGEIIDYGKVEPRKILTDIQGREERAACYEELTQLSEQWGPTRKQRRDVKGDIEAAIRALEALLAPPPKTPAQKPGAATPKTQTDFGF
jgi:hypothetical protein